MNYTQPVYLGRFRAMRAGDVEDRYIDISGDLDTGETVTSAVVTVADSGGDTVAAVSNQTYSAARMDFRLTAPATAGGYTLTAAFTISDGQQITRYAQFLVV